MSKKIDDGIYVWAPNLQTLESRLKTVKDRCQNINVTILNLKFEIGSKLQFTGFIVTQNGVCPDPKRTDALERFPMSEMIMCRHLALAFILDSITATANKRRKNYFAQTSPLL